MVQNVTGSGLPKPARGKVGSAEAVELASVKAQRDHLLHLLKANQTNEITKCGYLYKNRMCPSSVLGSNWEARYFSLTGQTLMYWKSQKETVFLPRVKFPLAGCRVIYEGSKLERWHVFEIVSSRGLTVMRLSTDNKSDADAWIAALSAATQPTFGKHVVYRSNSLAHPPAASGDARWSGGDAPDTDSDCSVSSVRSGRRFVYSTPFRESMKRLHRDTDAVSCASDDSSLSMPLEPAEGGSATQSPRATRMQYPAGRIPRPGSGQLAAAAASGATDAKYARGVMRGSTPVHTSVKFSQLSSERIQYQQHSGLINLGMVIILTANSRLIIENILKYGLRLNLVRWVRRAAAGSGNFHLLLSFPGLLLIAMLALLMEWGLAARLRQELAMHTGILKKTAPDGSGRGSAAVPAEVAGAVPRLKRAAAAHACTTEALAAVLGLLLCAIAPLALPCWVVWSTVADPVPSAVLLLMSVTLWMKLISYAHCNHDCRNVARTAAVQAVQEAEAAAAVAPNGAAAEPADAAAAGEPLEAVQYPANLTVRNMLWYLVAPTLTYQISYPMTTKFRPRWLARRVLELLAYMGLMLFIVEQYMAPTIMNSMLPIQEMNALRVAERVLKLSLPTMYAWLCMFYCLFHLYLNILAELTGFGDREFYKDWWNATTLGEYWKTWNMPVHKWLLRTIYFPAIRCGVSRATAGILVFLVSGVIHELVVGVPLHMIRCWAFLGMVFQVPLIFLTEAIKKRLKNDHVGNIIFWVTFCVVGQPMAILLYYHDFLIESEVQSRRV